MAAAKRLAEVEALVEKARREAAAEAHEEEARVLRSGAGGSGNSPPGGRGRGRGRGGRGGRGAGAGEYPRFNSAVRRAAEAGAHFKVTLEYRRPGAAASATCTMAFTHYDTLQVEAVPTLYTSMSGEEREQLLSFCTDVARLRRA
jgi:hypothetical protein